MNEGASACAAGIAGACDELYLPDFMWPGVVILGLILLLLLFLSRKKIIKTQFRITFIAWLVITLAFAGIVALRTESVGDRTLRAAEHCQASGNPTCEY